MLRLQLTSQLCKESAFFPVDADICLYPRTTQLGEVKKEEEEMFGKLVLRKKKSEAR